MKAIKHQFLVEVSPFALKYSLQHIPECLKILESFTDYNGYVIGPFVFPQGMGALLERMNSLDKGHGHHIGDGKLVLGKAGYLSGQSSHLRTSISGLGTRTPVVWLGWRSGGERRKS